MQVLAGRWLEVEEGLWPSALNLWTMSMLMMSMLMMSMLMLALMNAQVERRVRWFLAWFLSLRRGSRMRCAWSDSAAQRTWSMRQREWRRRSLAQHGVSASRLGMEVSRLSPCFYWAEFDAPSALGLQSRLWPAAALSEAETFALADRPTLSPVPGPLFLQEVGSLVSLWLCLLQTLLQSWPGGKAAVEEEEVVVAPA
jgi:hypothetical protein